MKFKNIHTNTGRLRFNGVIISFVDVLETEDKALINFLKNSPNWELISVPKSDKVSELKSDKSNV